MTGPSLQAAVDELYSSPMAEFTARRKVLADSARKSGDRETATQIGALRKPTRSADTLNRLVRTASHEVDELLDLGAALRAAEKALDGPRMRELSTQRRQLVGALTKLAFDITDQPNPSAAVREEVSATLNAALADEQVAERLSSGALVTHAQWDGFGSTSLPELAAVLPMHPSRRSKPPRGESREAGPEADESSASADEVPPANVPTTTNRGTKPVTRPRKTDRSTEPAAETQRTAQEKEARRAQNEAKRSEAQAAAAKAAADRERQQRLESAQLEAAQADQAATAAQHELRAIDRRISELSLQLANQRQLLADAQRAVRSTEARRRAAHLAVTRAGGSLG